MFQGRRALVTLKLGYKCHGQRAILSLDSIGRSHRDGPDRCRESNKLRSGARAADSGLIFVPLVVELGAGSALPSLLAATLPKGRHASLVVATEYPDPLIMDTLRGNVERARGAPHPAVDGTEESEEGEECCKIECGEYEWGSDVSQLLLGVSPSSSLTCV